MRCNSCGFWNRCPQCSNYTCDFCGSQLPPPFDDDLAELGNFNVGAENELNFRNVADLDLDLDLDYRRYP